MGGFEKIGQTADLAIGRNTEKNEASIMQSSIKKMMGVGDTPFSRLTGLKTPITYYKKNVGNVFDDIYQSSKSNRIDPSFDTFTKIEDMFIVTESLNMSETDIIEGVKEVGQEGVGKLPPRCLPNADVGDMFIMTTDENRVNVYIVESVSRSENLSDDPWIIIGFKLEILNVKSCPFEDKVIETLVYKHQNIGTRFRCLILKSEAVFLEEIESAYIEMADVYHGLFYKKVPNTFMLKKGTSDKVKRDTYDRYLMEFMERNAIFYKVGGVHRITNYGKLKKDVYQGTLFYSLEKRMRKYLKYAYQLIVTEPFGSDITNPLSHTMDTVEHVESLNASVKDMYPPNLVMRMLNHDNTRLDPNSLMVVDPDEFISKFMTEYITNPDCDLSKWLRVYMDQWMYEVDYTVDNSRFFYTAPFVAYMMLQTMIFIQEEDNLLHYKGDVKG